MGALTGPFPDARVLVKGSQVGKLLAVAAGGVGQRGGSLQTLLSVMGKKHLDSLRERPLLSSAYSCLACDGGPEGLLSAHPPGGTVIARPAQLAVAARPPSPAWTLMIASAGAFMTCVDTMVVTTALPVLRVSLHGTLADLEWTVNAYNLAFACLLLTGATLGDRFGRRRMFCIGLAAFTTASAAAALSPTAGALIAARAVQGAAAALVLPLTLTLISDAFSPGKRGRAIGVWGGVISIGGAVGPVIGGVVADGLSWQWIFWLNVPVGAVLIPLAASRLRESRGPAAPLDATGLLLAGTGFLGLTWALAHASTAGWSGGQVIGPLAAGAV